MPEFSGLRRKPSEIRRKASKFVSSYLLSSFAALQEKFLEIFILHESFEEVARKDAKDSQKKPVQSYILL